MNISDDFDPQFIEKTFKKIQEIRSKMETYMDRNPDYLDDPKFQQLEHELKLFWSLFNFGK